MSVDVVEFVRARLDEWEASARSATPGPWRVERQTHPRDGDPWGHTIEPGIFDSEGGSIPPTEQDSAHIARHDPARVLAEVEALRRIVDEHEHMPRDDREPDGPFGCDTCDTDPLRGGALRGSGWCSTIRALAAIWRDHRDYDPAWAPEESHADH